MAGLRDKHYNVKDLPKSKKVVDTFPDLRSVFAGFEELDLKLYPTDIDLWIRYVILLIDPKGTVAPKNNSWVDKQTEAAGMVGMSYEAVSKESNREGVWELIRRYFLFLNYSKYEMYFSLRIRLDDLNLALRDTSKKVDFTEHGKAIDLAKKAIELEPIIEEIRLEIFGNLEDVQMHMIENSKNIIKKGVVERNSRIRISPSPSKLEEIVPGDDKESRRNRH